MRLRRTTLVALFVGVTAFVGGGTSWADHNDCHNEPGDRYYFIVGVDEPGTNGYVFACIGNGNYGYHHNNGCYELIINSEEIGGC